MSTYMWYTGCIYMYMDMGIQFTCICTEIRSINKLHLITSIFERTNCTNLFRQLVWLVGDFRKHILRKIWRMFVLSVEWMLWLIIDVCQRQGSTVWYPFHVFDIPILCTKVWNNHYWKKYFQSFKLYFNAKTHDK